MCVNDLELGDVLISVFYSVNFILYYAPFIVSSIPPYRMQSGC